MIKEGSRETGPAMDILGIRCDAQRKTVRLAGKFTAKHHNILRKAAESSAMILTVRSAMRIVGILCRVACVMQVPFYMLPNFLKVASELAHPPIDSVVRLALPLQPRQLARIGLENHEVPIDALMSDPRLNRKTIVITDASRVGFGIIIIKEMRLITYSGRWHHSVDNMPLLEARALIMALAFAHSRNISLMGALWLTDSMTVLEACKSGHSKVCEINEAVRIFHEHDMLGKHIVSEANPADTMSKVGQGGLSESDIKKLENLCAPNSSL